MCFSGLLSDVIINGGWNLPDELTSIPGVASRLPSVVLPSSELPDFLSWPLAQDGKLTVKLAYSFLTSHTPCVPWASTIWNSCIPPSHSFICWRLAHDRLPTDDNLSSRGCALVSMCSFCLEQVETSDHLFLRCKFVVTLWSWLCSQLHVGLDFSSIKALMSSLPRHCSSQVRDLYVAAVVHMVHSIWWARNNVRFSSAKVSSHAVQVRVHAFIGLSGAVSTGKCIAADAAILDAFRIPPHRRSMREIVSVCWKPPSAPWVKVNTDGSVLNNSGACGGLFRDHLGTFLGAFVGNLGRCSVFDTEVSGFILVMEHAALHGWYNIWLESDASSALMVFKNPSLVPILLRNRWHNARTLNVQVISSHIFREGNVCVDRLANLGHSVVGEVWLSTLPSDFHQVFYEDRCGMPRIRYP